MVQVKMIVKKGGREYAYLNCEKCGRSWNVPLSKKNDIHYICPACAGRRDEGRKGDKNGGQ